MALPLVEEDQVEVAVVIQLAAAELAEPDDRPARTTAVVGPSRDPEPEGAAVPLVPRGQDHDRLRDVRQLAGHVADRLPAEDVAGADPDPLLVPEAEQDRRQVLGPPAEIGELGLDR